MRVLVATAGSVLLGLATASSLSAAVTLPYVTGFEASEGFTPGSVAGQNGWTSFVTDGRAIQPQVNTASPVAGSRDLAFRQTAGVPQTAWAAAFSPVLQTQATDALEFRTTFQVTGLLLYAGADYAVLGTRGVTPSFEVALAYTGRIYVRDLVNGSSQLVDTGERWLRDFKHNFRVVMDPALGQARYFLDDEQFYAGSFVGVTGFDQVSFFGNNFALDEEVGRFDGIQVSVVPEPAIGGTVLLIGAVLCRRSRPPCRSATAAT